MRTTRVLLLLGLLFVSACVEDQGVDDTTVTVSMLKRRVASLELEVEGMKETMAAKGLEFAEMRQALDAIESRLESAGAPAALDPSVAAAMAANPDFGSFLKTDAGLKLLQQGIADVEERRSQERRERAFENRVNKMREEMGLTDYQAEQVQAIVEKYTPQLREVWTEFRQATMRGEGEGVTNREEAMRRSRELREEMNAEARPLLSEEQFAKFEAMNKRTAGRALIGGNRAGGGQGRRVRGAGGNRNQGGRRNQGENRDR